MPSSQEITRPPQALKYGYSWAARQEPQAPPALSAEEWLLTAGSHPGITSLIFLLAGEVPCIATSQGVGRGARSTPGSRKSFQPAVPGVAVEQPQGQGTTALGGRGRQWDTGQVLFGTWQLWPWAGADSTDWGRAV